MATGHLAEAEWGEPGPGSLLEREVHKSLGPAAGSQPAATPPIWAHGGRHPGGGAGSREAGAKTRSAGDDGTGRHSSTPRQRGSVTPRGGMGSSGLPTQRSASKGLVPELYRKPGSLSAHRQLEDSSGYLEVFPRIGKKQPRLLENLEIMLSDKLRAAEKLSTPGGTLGKAPVAANMSLDAHRQCFDAFIQAFNTYKPLLNKIKQEYDSALDAALRAEHENIHMRAELKMFEKKNARSVEEARAGAAAQAAEFRAELYSKLEDMEQRAIAAETRAEKAEADAAEAREKEAEATATAEEYRQANASLRQLMLDESTWGKKEVAPMVSKKVMEPMKMVEGGSLPDLE